MRAIAAVSDPRSEFYRPHAPREPARQRADGPAHGDRACWRCSASSRATRNWHRIGREWWFGDEPATELGREEWAYFESKGEKRVRKFGARAT